MPPAGVPPDADPRGMILAIVILLLVILGTGILFYQSQEGQIKDRVTGDLTAIQTLKGDQIAAWREDRLYDARGLASSAFFIEGVDHFLTYGDDESKNTVLRRFREMNTSPHYDNVLLVDPNGTVRLSLDPSVTSVSPPVIDQVNASIRSGNATLTDFYRIPGASHASMDVIAPLSISRAGVPEPVGAVLLSINPDGFLYPLIQSWPVPSRSAETLLVEREGDYVLYLNELRHQNNTALNLTIPLTQTDVPAVKAVLGTTGAFIGKDYRGVDVISVLGPVPGSPWYMVAKVDTAEAYSSWQSHSVLIIALVGGSLAGALIIVGLLWQRRQKYYYQSLYALESERTREEHRNRERLEILLHLAEMESAGEQELAEFVLDAGCRLTESPVAFIGKLSPDETVFETAAWSKPVKKDSPSARMTRRLPCEKAGIWAEAVRKRTTVIVNGHAAPLEEESRVRAGYDPVTQFVSVPIFEEQRLVVVFTVANRETGYTAIDVDNLTLLAQGVWNHLRKRTADELLRQKSTDLEAAFEEITATDEELRANYEELSRNQQALKKSEASLRRFYDSGLFGVIFWNIDGKITDTNDEFLRITGYTHEDLEAGRIDLVALTPAEFRDRDDASLEELKANGKNRVPFEKEYFRKDGSRVPILIAGAMLDDQRHDGVAFVLNISDLKTARAALDESERKYRNLYHYAQVGLFETSFKDATVVACNQRYADLAGFASVEEAIGKDILGLYVNPEDRTEVGRILRETGFIENHTVRFRNLATGKVFWAQFSARFNYERDTAEGTIIDITVQKEAEEALRESEEQFRTAFEDAALAMALTAMDGRLLRVNHAFCILLGYSEEQMLGMTFRDISLPEEIPQTNQLMADTIAGKTRSFSLEKRYVRKDGRLVEALVNSMLLRDPHGEPRYFITHIQDITERKKAEEEIKSANAFLDMIIDMSPFAMWISDKEGTVTRVNRSLCRTINLTRDDIVGRYNVLKDVNLEREGVMPSVKAVFETFTPAQFSIPWKAAEVRDVDFEGARDMYIEVSLFPILNARGELTNVVCQWVDVTDRKKAEDDLRETNEYLENLFNYANAPIIVWDPAFRITRFNHAFEYLTGRTEQDVVGQHLAILFPKTSRDAIFELIRKTLFGERWEVVEIPIRHISGETRIVLWNSANIVNSQGTLISTIAQGQDITERKLAEEALKANEHKFQILADFTYDWAYWIDTDFRMIYTSPSCERIAGYSPEEFANNPDLISTIVHPDDRELYLKHKADVHDHPAMGTLEFRILHRDGSVRWLGHVCRPILDREGQFMGTRVSNRDITDQKAMERQREALIRVLERKNAELERFTFTVSHDLKSPLITIKGFASLLEDDARAGDPLQLKKDVGRISAAADTMQALLSDLLELSRIGRIAKPPEKTPFGTIAREAVELLAGPLAGRGVTVEIAPGLPYVYVDHARIREVMVNLIENSVKFAGDRPDPVIRIGVEQVGERPVFFVQDNGIGINPKYLERVFNLFERLDVSTHGTGIGLTIARRVIEVHGGKIWAESEGAGKGTTFKFTLPGMPDTRDDF
jgi:PAS domain S-box-containing protein